MLEKKRGLHGNEILAFFNLGTFTSNEELSTNSAILCCQTGDKPVPSYNFHHGQSP